MDTLGAMRTLGLSEKEALIYLALLELGEDSAYAVAQRARLKKPTTYVLLDELIEKNFVFKVPKSGRKVYRARSPQEMFNHVREKFNDAEQLLPELIALARNNQKDAKILFFEGTQGMREAWRYRIEELKNSEIQAFYASTLDVTKEIEQLAMEWNESNVKHNIKTKAIVPDHPSLKKFRALDEAHHRTVKVVPSEQYSARMSIEITEQFVRIVMFKETQTIIIDNPNVAETFKQIFEMAWNSN